MIKGWEIILVSDFIDIQNGFAFKSENFIKNGIPLVKIASIQSKKVVVDEKETYPKIVIDEKFKVHYNDLVIAMSGATTGKIGLYKYKNYAYLNQRVCKISSRNQKKLINKYLFYLFSSHSFANQMNECLTAGAQPNLSPSQIGAMKFFIPTNIDEQQRMVYYLENIDYLVESLKQMIKKKKLIKQGVMQELLTGKKRLPGFNKEWKQVELGSLGEIYNGLTGKTKNDFGWGNSKYVTFLNVLNNRKLNNKLFEKVNINEVQNFIKYGDLFFNTSSEIPEEVALCSAFMDKTNENIAVNSFCFGFRLYDLKRIFPLYIVDYFRSNDGRKKIIQIAQGSTRYNLSKEYFLKLLIPIPEYEEQKAISTIISDIDDEINFLEQELEKYKNIKQGMMEQLLTGKIRLIEFNENIQSMSDKKHNQHFDDAVVFANIVASCYSPDYPLGRKKCQKMMYLFKRFNNSSVEQFGHYAAGPYDNKARYGGFETIAIKNKYVVENKSNKGSSFAPGPDIDKAKSYCSKYGYDKFIPIFNQYLKFKKVDELELYTTVDKTILELKEQNLPINLNTVKNYISNDKTWVPKLTREVFNDENIEEAIRFSQLILGV